MTELSRYQSLQRALARMRLEVNLTQAEVALRLGRPQSFVSKYESGERCLDVIEFLDVCHALSADPRSIVMELEGQNDSK